MSSKVNVTAGPAMGDTVASIIAPGERYGRVVGFRKRGRRDRRVIVREYVPGDGRWPSGEYRYTAPDAVVPIMGGGVA